MSEQGFEKPQGTKYRVVETTVNDDWIGERRVKTVEVNPEMLTGFETTAVPREIVATILTHTMNGIREHGASAIGLDLDSMRGSMAAEGHIDTAVGIGSSVLEDLAPRTDGATWKEWIKEEFPGTIAALYGEGSNLHFIAKDVVDGDSSQTVWTP